MAGGEQTVGDSEINQLLLDDKKDLPFCAASSCLTCWRECTLSWPQEAIDLITGDPYQPSPKEVDFINEKLQVACYWANVIEKLMHGPLGLQTLNIKFDSGRMQVPHNPVYIFQGENVAFQIPKLWVYLWVRDLLYGLTGQQNH